MSDSKITLQSNSSILDISDASQSANTGISVGQIRTHTATQTLTIGGNTTSGVLTIGNTSHSGNLDIVAPSGSGTVQIYKGGSGSGGWWALSGSGSFITSGASNAIHIGEGLSGQDTTTGAIHIGREQTSGITNIGTGSSKTGAINIGNSASGRSITIDAGTAEVNIRGANGLRADDGISFDSGTNTMSVYTAKNFFTPSIGSATVDFTMTTQRGRFTRIGDLIVFHIHIVWTGHNSATAGDDLRLKSLPVTQDSDSQYEASFTLGQCDAFNGLTSNGYVSVNGINNTTSADCAINDMNAGTSNAVTVGDTDTSGFIRISGSYIAN